MLTKGQKSPALARADGEFLHTAIAHQHSKITSTICN